MLNNHADNRVQEIQQGAQGSAAQAGDPARASLPPLIRLTALTSMSRRLAWCLAQSISKHSKKKAEIKQIHNCYIAQPLCDSVSSSKMETSQGCWEDYMN